MVRMSAFCLTLYSSPVYQSSMKWVCGLACWKKRSLKLPVSLSIMLSISFCNLTVKLTSFSASLNFIQIHRGTLGQIAQELKENERSSVKPSQPQPIVKNINQSWLKERENGRENGQEIVCGVKALKTKLETKSNELLDDAVDAKNVQNGSDSHCIPPKPLPRASRNGSLSELNEELPPVSNSPPPIISAPKPVARPRSTATGVVTGGGYKVSFCFLWIKVFSLCFCAIC